MQHLHLLARHVWHHCQDAGHALNSVVSGVLLGCRGRGSTKTEWGSISWSKGDVFVLPAASRPVTHHADSDEKDGAAFYWVHDEPLLNYLGVKPNETRFEPTLFRAQVLC